MFTPLFSKLPSSIQTLLKLVIKTAQPKQVILFGSRARETNRDNSDFDIAVQGKTCSDQEWTRLVVEISEAPLTLYHLDLVELEKLSADYMTEIKKEGKLLYG